MFIGKSLPFVLRRKNYSFGHTCILFPMICISDACTHSVLLRLKPCKRLTSELIHHAGQSIWLQLNDVMVSPLCHIREQIEPISFKWDAILSRSHTHASTHSLSFRINRFEFISIHYCAIHLTLLCAKPPEYKALSFSFTRCAHSMPVSEWTINHTLTYYIKCTMHDDDHNQSNNKQVYLYLFFYIRTAHSMWHARCKCVHFTQNFVA